MCVAAAAVLVSGGLEPARAQRPKHRGKVAMFGNLHAHSKLSGDIQNAGDEMLPARAFAYAQKHGLDFLAISDHHKATDTQPRYFVTAADYTSLLYDAAMAFNKKAKGKFVAIPAIEWGTTKTGNHVNVFGAKTLPPDTIADADYDELYAWAAGNAEFVQFNHPDSWYGQGAKRNQAVGNFGEALFDTVEAFVAAADPVAKTCSIITSVHGGHITGTHKDSTAKTHRAVHRKNFGRWLALLNKGLHVSPAANQDTHRKNWGTVTAARTVVWADGASYDGLMAGLKANRVYATEDDELVVAFQVARGGYRYWMGHTIHLDGDEADVEAIVKIWQAKGADGDSTHEGPYTVTIYSDADGIGGREAAVWSVHAGIEEKKETRIPLHVVAGEYIFVQVTEENGRDNPVGDGDDELDNATGAQGADGQRDDLNDSAWTSPVWFAGSANTQTFVWSKKSNVYHDPSCWAVAQIGSANRREGPAPDGKAKHGCTPGQ